MQMRIITNRWRVGGCFLFAFGALSLGVLQAQDDGTIITTSEDPVVVIDSYEAALDENTKQSDLNIGEAVEPDFFNDIVDRIRGIFTNDDGSVEIGFLEGVFKSDTPALRIDQEGDAILQGDLTVRTVKSAGDLTVGSPEEVSNTEGKAITVGDKDRGVIELHGGDGQDITAKGIVQMGDFGMELGTLTNQVLKFFTNSTPRMSITSDGSVGIGTDDPEADLHVENGSFVLGNTDNHNMTFVNIPTGELTRSEIYFRGENGDTDWSIRNMNNSLDILNFQDVANGSNFSINREGNVGIGTTLPSIQSKLDVRGNVSVGTHGKWGIRDNGNAEYFVIEHHNKDGWNDADIKFSVGSNGNVGIGTTNPKEMLHISRNGDYQLRLENNNENGGGYWNIGQSNDSWDSGGDKLVFIPSSESSSDSTVTFQENGNVGIGTTDPESALHIKRNSNDQYALKVYNGGGQALGVEITGGANSETPLLNVHSAYTGYENGDRQALWVQSDGKVGIGNTDPSTKLEVDGSVTAKSFIGDGSQLTGITAADNLGNHTATTTLSMTNHNVTGVNTMQINDPGENEGISWSGTAAKIFVSPLNSGNADGYIRMINDGGISFEAGSEDTEDMVITSSGNVGIGTTSPGAKLEVNGGAIKVSPSYEETFMFGNTNETGTPSGDGFRFVFTDDVQQQDNDFVAFQKTDGNGANPDGGFVFQGRGNDGVIENIMTVDTQNNRVGIGTTYPGAKLEVDGDTSVSGSVTATSFLYSSDQNKKKNIQTLNNPLETIQNLRGVSFRWQENDEKSIGFIAQEVEKVLPSLVSGEAGEKSVAYGNLTAVLVEAVKELSAEKDAEIALLRQEISDLKADNQQLWESLESLTD